jgi:predicted transcriptional regulator
MIIMATALTTAEVAEALETTPRTLRKFLRSDANKIAPVGKGHRYSIAAGQVRTLRSQFAKWTAAQDADKGDNSSEVPEADNED